MNRFKVNLATGTIEGPTEYMASESFKETARRIENGTHCLIGAAPADCPTNTLVEVIFQTDYAAWLGNKEMMSWSKR